MKQEIYGKFKLYFWSPASVLADNTETLLVSQRRCDGFWTVVQYINIITCRIDGEASPEAEQVQLNGEKDAETREGETLQLHVLLRLWNFFVPSVCFETVKMES
jgi:hypothetical protein